MRFQRFAMIAVLVLLMVPAFPEIAPEALAKGANPPTATKAQRGSNKPRTRKIKRTKVKYKVVRGDSLKVICARYGVTTAQLQRWNPSLKNGLVAGKTLTIWATRVTGSQRTTSHTVKRGETLATIAKKHKVKVKDLKNWNPRVNTRALKIGTKLKIVVWTPGPASKSEGRPGKGRLSGGTPLQSGKGYHVRNVSRAWGTGTTVRYIDQCIANTKKRFPKAHELLIGDISYERGGHMRPHKSHQTGRDADISYYFKGGKNARRFLAATPETLDVVKTWYLFEKFIATGKVVYIFVDYNLQEVLYKHAKKKGKNKAYLDKVFQYPNGRGSSRGIIRYSRGHDDHFHIRFTCDPKDGGCKL